MMQLFAIIANTNKDGDMKRSQEVVEAYLRQHLSQEQLTEYLTLFSDYVAFHHRDEQKKDGERGRKRTSANSVKVLMICEQINEELQQKEKVIVLLRLLEFINQGEEVTAKELDFVKTVSDIFKISENEYHNIYSFIIENIDEIPEKDRVLVINEFCSTEHEEFKHIQIKNFHGNLLVLNITSTNSYVFRYDGDDDLYHNGRNVLPDRIYLFDKGSSIRSRRVNPVYYSDVVSSFLHSQTKSKISFVARDIEFRFPNSENGIYRFSFVEDSGQMIGIMGSSGVGKSTLLNVLNGNIKTDSGDILINGYDIQRNNDKLEGVIGFVPQDDLLIEELSVFQNLYFNAKLCFSNFTERQICKAVIKVLIDLDLNEIRNLTVGNSLNKFISGGQRKRLNIALELIREPSVLFVDEPTSGLSSRDSEMVMDLLKEQALKGKLVIVNIHQPSSDIYKLFDKLLIMDKGGRPVYYGDPTDAIVYFKTMTNHVNASEANCLCCGTVNPEQVLQILEAKLVNEYGRLTRNRKISAQEWYTLYQKNIEAKLVETNPALQQPKDVPPPKLELPKNYFKIPKPIKQFKIYSLRDILSKLTNKQYLFINFLEAPLLASILAFFSKFMTTDDGGVYSYLFSQNENLPAYLFMSVVVALFIGLTVSAEEIIRDRKIIQREQFLHLSRFSYLNSKVLIMFALSSIQMLTFVLLGNLIMEIHDMTLSYWLILFTTACFANMMGLNISSGLNSVVTIYILIPFILVPQLLLSGTIVKFEKLHHMIASQVYVPFVGDMMTSRWAYEALVVTQFKYNKYEREFYDVEREKSVAGYKKNYLINELQSKVNSCEKNVQQMKDKEWTVNNLLILKNEIAKLQDDSNLKPFKYSDSLIINKFTAVMAERTRKYLEKLYDYYSHQYDAASAKMDAQYEQLLAVTKNKEEISLLKQKYFNENLADLVLNTQELKKITEADNRLIQTTEPIFNYPTNNFGRAHFYAPVKRFMGVYIDTFWFNILALWFMTGFMYITLLHDTVRKTIDFLSSVKLFKLFKKQSGE